MTIFCLRPFVNPGPDLQNTLICKYLVNSLYLNNTVLWWPRKLHVSVEYLTFQSIVCGLNHFNFSTIRCNKSGFINWEDAYGTEWKPLCVCDKFCKMFEILLASSHALM